MKTAKALGLDVPTSILLSAVELIESDLRRDGPLSAMCALTLLGGAATAAMGQGRSAGFAPLRMRPA
jgi:hypothetical protein